MIGYGLRAWVQRETSVPPRIVERRPFLAYACYVIGLGGRAFKGSSTIFYLTIVSFTYPSG